MIRRRRLRASENLRALVRETSVSASDLIYPVFVIEGKDIKNPIDSMPESISIPSTVWMRIRPYPRGLV